MSSFFLKRKGLPIGRQTLRKGNLTSIRTLFQNLIRQKFFKDKFPTKYQWSQFFKILNKKEYYFLSALILIFLISLFFIGYKQYILSTQIEPKFGGKYTEGIVGTPRFINPVLCQSRDIDRDLSSIIYSSLMKYDSEGNLIPDLAEKYSILDDGKTYEITLKKDVKWHDGKIFNADDVIFTLQTIQNPDYKSPLRVTWLGVDIEKVDDLTIRFKLKNVYAPFLHNLTFGILPKHIWKTISTNNFALSNYNLKPIGTGPYKIKRLEKDKSGIIKSITLESYKDYHFHPPFIKILEFKFFKNEESALKAFNQREIDGLGFISTKNINQIKLINLTNIYSLSLPRYFAIFFNQTKSKVLSDKNVRLALAYATNKQKIIDEVLSGQGTVIDSPILPNLFGYNKDIKIYNYDLEKSKEILEKNKWQDSDGDGIREKKENEETLLLEINLLTSDWPELVETANLLKKQWEEIGAKVNIDIKETSEIQKNYIKSREYQALLFGEVLGIDPDPFAFWHSSQKKAPGLNLALYDNKEVDKLIEEARQELNPEIRAQKYARFQELVIEDIPVIFLYSPNYFYAVDKKVKDVKAKNISTPADRFSGIENWYIKTKRVFK